MQEFPKKSDSLPEFWLVSIAERQGLQRLDLDPGGKVISVALYERKTPGQDRLCQFVDAISPNENEFDAGSRQTG